MKIDLRKVIADFDVRERASVITIVILVWLALNLAFTFLVNVPRAGRLTALEDEVNSMQALIAGRRGDVERLKPHHTRVVEGNTDLDKFFEEVLSTKGKRLIGFQKEIRDIARKFNINMDAISYPRESMPKDKVTKLSAVMPLTGSYENLRSFIRTIEASENFIAIESVQLANSKEGGVILSLNITLSTWFVDPDLKEESRPVRARRS